MANLFYRAFEEEFRGSRELIKDRLRVYLPFVEPLLHEGRRPVAVDLGCGRGEWLELLDDAGVAASGVDLDEGMLEACQALGLNVRVADALASLRTLPSNSVDVVSAFHVAEHLSFDVLQALLGEAHRVLAPGGLLIFETPNPENLIVGTAMFYMDPTHQRPIPCHLLHFLVRFAGFDRSKVLRLQEPQGAHAPGAVGLQDLLRNVSPDYAVIGQKTAPVAVLAHWDALFAQDFGISLDSIAARYDAQRVEADRQIANVLQQSASADGRIAVLEQQVACLAQQLENRPGARLIRLANRLRSAVREGRVRTGLARRLAKWRRLGADVS